MSHSKNTLYRKYVIDTSNRILKELLTSSVYLYSFDLRYKLYLHTLAENKCNCRNQNTKKNLVLLRMFRDALLRRWFSFSHAYIHSLNKI